VALEVTFFHLEKIVIISLGGLWYRVFFEAIFFHLEKIVVDIRQDFYRETYLESLLLVQEGRGCKIVPSLL
jgi:hypothetical protein